MMTTKGEVVHEETYYRAEYSLAGADDWQSIGNKTFDTEKSAKKYAEDWNASESPYNTRVIRRTITDTNRGGVVNKEEFYQLESRYLGQGEWYEATHHTFDTAAEAKAWLKASDFWKSVDRDFEFEYRIVYRVVTDTLVEEVAR